MEAIVETRAVQHAVAIARQVLADSHGAHIGCIVGESGTGKSTAVKRIADELGAVVVTCWHEIGANALLQTLVKQITGGVLYGPPHVFYWALAEHRAHNPEAPRLIILDEANHLGWRPLEAVRYLADELGYGVLLVGTDLLDRPFSHPQTKILLAQFTSRIGSKRLVFKPLAHDAIARYVLAPRWGELPKAVVRVFHDECKGYWRDALALAEACGRVIDMKQADGLSTEVVQAAAAYLAGRA